MYKVPMEYSLANFVCEVLPQVQEKCHPRSQFILAEAGPKSLEECGHDVTHLTWEDRLHCADDVQVSQRGSEVGRTSQKLGNPGLAAGNSDGTAGGQHCWQQPAPHIPPACTRRGLEVPESPLP